MYGNALLKIIPGLFVILLVLLNHACEIGVWGSITAGFLLLFSLVVKIASVVYMEVNIRFKVFDLLPLLVGVLWVFLFVIEKDVFWKIVYAYLAVESFYSSFYGTNQADIDRQ